MAKKAVGESSSTRNYYELWGPPAVFILLVIVGCIYIILAKQFGVKQVLITFVPVLFMLAYAAVMGFARFLRLRDDQAGDNLYYMGFLFTLTSLGASLYHFDASGDAEYIVQNFGIAIASTIAGIALRVLFNQMRRDPVEVERVARFELAEAARRVRTELDHTVLEFNHFRRAAMQSMQEGFDEIGKNVEIVGQKLLSGLEDITEKSAAPLEVASKRSGATIEELTNTVVAALEASARKLSAENEKLSDSAKAIAGSIDGVKERLTAMQAPDEVIQIKLDPTMKGLASAVDRFTTTIDRHEKVIETALDSARLYSETSRDTAEAIKIKATDSEAGMIKVIGALKETISSFETTAKAQADQVAAVMKRTDETLATLKGMSAAASEREMRHMETLSKLLPADGKGENVVELSKVEEVTASQPETKIKPRWGFGTGA
jgi:hypothetical protein